MFLNCENLLPTSLSKDMDWNRNIVKIYNKEGCNEEIIGRKAALKTSLLLKAMMWKKENWNVKNGGGEGVFTTIIFPFRNLAFFIRHDDVN